MFSVGRTIIFILAVAVCGLPQEERRVKLELKETQPTTTLNEVANVKVYFETDKVQTNASEGMNLFATFVNAGSSPVTLLNPKDLTQPEILTSDGWPVRVPAIGLGSYIHRIPEKNESQPATNVLLAPGQEYKLAINVLKVFPIRKGKAQGRQEASTDEKFITIPPGRYKVRLVVSLVSAHGSTSKTPRMLASDWAEVTLGNQ